YLYLRDTAAPPVTAETAPPISTGDDFRAAEDSPAAPAPVTSRPTAHPASQDPEAQAPTADRVSANRPDPLPVAAAAARNEGYSEPPMPVEPPRPGSGPSTPSAPITAKPDGGADPVYKGNEHVTSEREAALMAMARTGAWPGTASERLKAADDLNDLGRTAEANSAYAKALSGSGLGDKQRILAYGGMAVTFQSMGMPDQARDAAQRILAINPRNAFALKLMEKLK